MQSLMNRCAFYMGPHNITGAIKSYSNYFYFQFVLAMKHSPTLDLLYIDTKSYPFKLPNETNNIQCLNLIFLLRSICLQTLFKISKYAYVIFRCCDTLEKNVINDAFPTILA